MPENFLHVLRANFNLGKLSHKRRKLHSFALCSV